MPARASSRDTDRPIARVAYSPDEVAEALGVSRGLVYRMLADGTIPSATVGRRRLIRAEALGDLLTRLEQE